MNRRERVLMAIRHEQPDFVPYNFHATNTVYTKICQHYGLPDNDAVVEFVGNHIVKVGSDFNVNPWAEGVKMKLVPCGGPLTTAMDVGGGLHTDEFGCVWNRSHGTPFPVAHPLAEDYSLFDSYSIPDPYRAGRFDSAKALAERYRGRVFLFGKLGMALFERAWSIRGMEQVLRVHFEKVGSLPKACLESILCQTTASQSRRNRLRRRKTSLFSLPSLASTAVLGQPTVNQLNRNAPSAHGYGRAPRVCRGVAGSYPVRMEPAYY